MNLPSDVMHNLSDWLKNYDKDEEKEQSQVGQSDE
jgi:hypothetical protein